MTESPGTRPDDSGGAGPLPPPPPPGKAGRIVAGALLIIVGSVLALPAGLCGGMVVADGDMSVMGLGLVAAIVAAAGAGIIWAGCRLAMADRPAGPLFAGIVVVLIIITFMFLASLENGML